MSQTSNEKSYRAQDKNDRLNRSVEEIDTYADIYGLEGYKSIPNHTAYLLDVMSKEEFEDLLGWLLSKEHKDELQDFVGIEKIVEKLAVGGKQVSERPEALKLTENLDSYQYKTPHKKTKKDFYYINDKFIHHEEGDSKTVENLLLDGCIRRVIGAKIKSILKDSTEGGQQLYEEVSVYPLTLADRVRTGADLIIKTKKDLDDNTFLVALGDKNPYAGAVDDWQQAKKEEFNEKRGLTPKKNGKRKRRRKKMLVDKKTGELIPKREPKFRKTYFDVKKLGLSYGEMRRRTHDILEGKEKYDESLKNILQGVRVLAVTKAEKKEAKFRRKQEAIKNSIEKLEQD